MGTSLISLDQAAKKTSSPMGSSFLSGVLATLVATPCTGPLLGPALGFAMTLPPFSSLLIFTTMGLGMASPYLVFSAFPKLVRYLPKPGNWMVVFKQLMGFLMMATCLWLVWVFAAQTSEIAVFLVLASLLLIAVGSWVYGHFGALHRKKVSRRVATVIAALIVFTGSAGAISVANNHRSSTTLTAASLDGKWEAYSPEKVAALRKEGTPVFVDFTAKWCLICQANKVTLHSSEIQKAFEDRGVVTMMADWTKKDSTITEALHHLGRSGVPVYVLYSGNPEEPPLILPQTLTGSIVKDYLAKIDEPV
jgi:thiol:disulfide interchange protein